MKEKKMRGGVFAYLTVPNIITIIAIFLILNDLFWDRHLNITGTTFTNVLFKI